MNPSQKDEIEALNAIYEGCIDVSSCQVESSQRTDRTVEIRICFANDCKPCRPSTSSLAVADFKLPSSYPHCMPPIYQISCPDLKASQRRRLDREMQNIYFENMGSPIIFLWINFISEHLLELINDTNVISTDSEIEICLESPIEDNDQQPSPVKPDTTSNAHSDIEIFTGEIVEDRKSKFQGHVAEVHCKEDVEYVLAKLLSYKKIAEATHNIYAYRIISDNGPLLSDCEDDGEYTAGGKLSHLLDIMQAENVIVIVTRWYGGVHLGSDRFRIINEIARQQLVANRFDKRHHDHKQSPSKGKRSKKK